MNSFVFLSFVLSFLVVQMAGFAIIDGGLNYAFNDLKDGVGDFTSGMSELYKVQTEKELENGDGEEELGGKGIKPDMVFAINKTAGAMAKVTEGLINGVVTKTGMNKIGVPVVDENSKLMEYVKYSAENMMMGMAVMMAGAGNLMRV